MIHILVVDDHEIVREGLRRALAHDSAFNVVGEAGSRHEAIVQIASLNPDIVVIDIHLPDGNGIDVVRWARTHSRKIGLIVLTVSHMPEQIKAAMQAGASGYVEKSAPIVELVSAIKHAAHSPLAFSTHRARDLFDYGSQAHGLTGRELEVLEILPSGKTIHQIAETLFLGDSTIKTHVAAIYRKLCVANRVAAINKAREYGLLP